MNIMQKETENNRTGYPVDPMSGKNGVLSMAGRRGNVNRYGGNA